jgi:hypothetical protein
MDIELCVCGDDIDERFLITELWTGCGPETVFIAYCSRCHQVAPFTVMKYGPEGVMDAGITAWNKKMIAMRDGLNEATKKANPKAGL